MASRIWSYSAAARRRWGTSARNSSIAIGPTIVPLIGPSPDPSSVVPWNHDLAPTEPHGRHRLDPAVSGHVVQADHVLPRRSRLPTPAARRTRPRRAPAPPHR